MSDRQVYASHSMPPKFDLASEQPRRESLVEQRLEHQIGPNTGPRIELHPPSPSQVNTVAMHQDQPALHAPHPPPRSSSPLPQVSQHQYHYQQPHGPNQQSRSTTTTTVTRTTTSALAGHDVDGAPLPNTLTMQNNVTERATSPVVRVMSVSPRPLAKPAAALASEIVDDDKTQVKIHGRSYSPYQVPQKIDLAQEQRIQQVQRMNSPSPRPNSRASSTRSRIAAEDLLANEAQLMRDIEELENKPYNVQHLYVEPNRQPSPASAGNNYYGQPETLNTAVMRSPSREIDNKSPLPFAFDNFTTKGVRGNIATVGAVEPDRPRAPIYPIVRRSPTPTLTRY